MFELDFADDELIATRSAYGGKINLEVAFPGKGVVVLTLRGAVFAPPKDAGSAIVEVLDLDLTALERGEGGGMSQAVEFSWRSLLDRGRRSELRAVPPPLLNPVSAGVGLLVG